MKYEFGEHRRIEVQAFWNLKKVLSVDTELIPSICSRQSDTLQSLISYTKDEPLIKTDNRV